MKLKFLQKFEWQTIGLIAGCYAAWFLLILYGNRLPLGIWIVAMALTVTFYLSIVHEVVHGHPTPYPILNQMLVMLPIGWVFPYERFRDTHMQHHETGDLTDPLDDPESWYVYASDWDRTGRLVKNILIFNNTLLGRMMIGPMITLSRFAISEFGTFMACPAKRLYLLRVWGVHMFLCIGLAAFVSVHVQLPMWYLPVAIYLGISVLLIRTFLEHQAVDNHLERTVIIEKCCPIAFLFLYNNLHALHHERPGIPWYRLPAVYRQQRERLCDLNNYYVYRSYGEIFRRYFLKPKEPVNHPLSMQTGMRKTA